MSRLYFSTLTAVLCFACGEQSEPVSACFVCAEQRPYARICDEQLGRLDYDGEVHYCNLYFGHTQRCEAAEICCERLGLVLNEVDVCVSPETLTMSDEPSPVED